MPLVTCVAFRAAEDKLPGDISRNWERIETVIPRNLTCGVMLDPKDSAVYVIGLKQGDAETANRLAIVLDRLKDERDNHPLIVEAQCRIMQDGDFSAHAYR